MLTDELCLDHYVIFAFALQALHNVVKNSNFHVVETSPTLSFLGDFLVNIDQLLDSKSLSKEFLFHFLLPKVVL